MADENVESDDVAPAEAEPVGKLAGAIARVRRAPSWANEHRLVAGVIVGTAVVLLIGIAVLMQDSGGGTGGDSAPDGMAAALEALDDGDHAAAREIAEALRASGSLPWAELGGPYYILGAVTAQEAAQKWGDEQIRFYALAAGYLEQARDRGFPKGRAPDGHFLLGKSLFLSGKIPQSRAALREALNLKQARKTEIHRLLAQAYLQDSNPKYAEALEHNTEYLADRTLEAQERLEGLVQRGRIQLGTGDIEQCRETLESLGPAASTNSEALILAGLLLLQEARALAADQDNPAQPPSKESMAKYELAIQRFREAQGHDTLQSQSTRKAYYLIGLAMSEMGQASSAMAQWARTRRVFPDSPAGFAAGLDEADLLRRFTKDDEALSAYRRALGAILHPEDFSNPWVSFDEVRQRMLTAYRDFLARGAFEQAVTLAMDLDALVPQSTALLMQAEAYTAWGQARLASAETMDPSEAITMRRAGRSQFRRAGAVYADLANSRIATREFSDDIWASAESFLTGHDFANATRQFRKYLEIEGRRRRPRALVGLAEALLAMDQVDAALESAGDCIRDFPRDAASFQARLLAAKAHVEKGEPDRAAELLRTNLDGELLSPDSQEWRESLLDLGIVLHHAGHHQEAIQRLSIAVARGISGPRAIHTGYLLAESYRRRAQDLALSLETEIVPPERIAATREMGRMYQGALDEFSNVITRLTERQGRAELSELERLMLRNSYFARGAMLHQLQRYTEAIQAYTDAANRYQNRPEALEAYMQIADAYRRLDQPNKAQIALRQAQGVLKRLPDDAPFTESTNHTGPQWQEMLDWMITL